MQSLKAPLPVIWSAVLSVFVVDLEVAAAEERARLAVGDHVMIARHYDHKRDVFIEGAREGEGEACFVVKEIRKDGVFLDHLTGSFRLAWSGEIKPPGSYDDLWFTSDGYRQHHPDADAVEQLRHMFRTVEDCE